MGSKFTSFSQKALCVALAMIFQPAAILAQTETNRVAQDNLNRVMQKPQAHSEFKPDNRMPQQPSLVLPDLGDVSSAALTPLDERILGERIMREIRRDPDYADDPVFYDYLNAIGQHLVGAARQQKVPGMEGAGTFAIQFELFGVRDRSINAFALPGGFIGVHTGLVVAAESESELASVLGHEIGHVTQKHIARMYSQQGTNSLIALASIIVAALAVSRNPGAAQGLAMGGQALAIQNQLSYSRDAEREADRIGLQILQAGGFNPQGMPDFFQRMQRANSIMESGVPAYVRTHPLTTDRIADMSDRVRSLPVRKVESSLEFILMKARTRLIQTVSTSNYPELRQLLNSLTRKPEASKQLEGFYGLALLDLKLGRLADAEAALQKARTLMQQLSGRGSPMLRYSVALESTAIDILMAKKQYDQAAKAIAQQRAQFIHSRTFQLQALDVQLKTGQLDEAIAWLKNQTKIQASDTTWWDWLSRAYAKKGRVGLHHAALAEKYVTQGAWVAAIEQTKLAKQAGDLDFYQASELDARSRQIQDLYRQELRDDGKRPG